MNLPSVSHTAIADMSLSSWNAIERYFSQDINRIPMKLYVD
jgi:hypothetical protein